MGKTIKHYTVWDLKKILKERMGAYNMNYTEHFLDYLKKRERDGRKF